MRLHRLVVEAFGPFATRQEVDFDALTDAGLFLLSGPTGAGKTSILDAVCFALYGQLPGARAGGRPRLRSDHAPAGTPARVVLELTVGGRRLEVTRSPEWQRPKKRGTGTTREPASTDVRELVAGQWRVLVGRRSDEAGLLLQELLGMGLEQFTKVVLLPQGEFAAFLRSGAEHRAELLGRLFDIDRYSGVETWLREERQRLARAVAQADAEVDAITARAHEAMAFITEPLAPEHEIAVAAPPGPELVEALAATAEQARLDAAAAVEQARTGHAAARSSWSDAVERAQRLSRYRDLQARLAALDAKDAEHRSRHARVDAAERAGRLQALLTRLDRCAEVMAAAEHACARADVGTQDAASLAELAGELQRELDRIDDAADLDEQAQRLDRRVAELRAARDAAAGRRDAALAALATAEQEAAGPREAIERAEPLAQQVTAAEQSVADATAVLQATVERIACEERLRALDDARRVAHDAELSCRQVLLEVRERRLAGMAAELAGALTEGEPCTVCGSAQHPRPAVADDQHVGEQDEAAARACHDTAATDLRLAEAALAECRAELAALATASRGLPVDLARQRLTQARAHAVRAGEARLLLAQAEQQLAALSTQRDLLVTREHSAAQDELGAATALAELEPRRAEVDEALGRLRGDAPDLATRRRDLAGKARQVEDALGAARAAATARVEVDSLEADLLPLLDELGFASAQQARSALLGDDELRALRAACERHESERAQVAALLAAPELADVAAEHADLADAEPPDLEALDAAVASTAAFLTECEHRAALTDGAARALHRLAGDLRDHDDVHREVRSRHAHVEELSRCLEGSGGGNTMRMRLSAFVLAARLEEVAAAASDRLLVMSDGRYTLVHTDELARSGARSGLGLHVVDGWTGVARETTTLSGGEAFLASLSLALGLADVVRAEAGGAHLETLFVDEGFGTLDEETLEEVMGVLDGLREGGRAVGLVSHVGELRSRITAQVEVHKGRAGSRITQRCDAAPVERVAG